MISVDTSDTREGGQWNNERFLGLTSLQEKFVDVLKKQALLVGTPRKALSPVRRYWESTATEPITDGVHIKLVSQWPGQKLVTSVWGSRRPTAPARNSAR
jgi:hypothetical protein